MIGVTQLPLPPDSDVIKFTNFDIIEGGTVRLEMIINGIPFRRLHQRGMRRYKPVWLNETGEVDGCAMLTDEKQAELESVFHFYCTQFDFSVDGPKEQRRLNK